MSVLEKSDGTPQEKSHWRCPTCWATQEKRVRPNPDAGPAGTVTCNACGAAFPESDVYGGKYDADALVAGPVIGAKRNPLALQPSARADFHTSDPADGIAKSTRPCNENPPTFTIRGTRNPGADISELPEDTNTDKRHSAARSE